LRTPAELIDAAVAAHVSWMCAVARATGGRVWTDDGLLAVHQPPPHNEVLLPFPERISASALERVLEWSASNGVRILGCWGRDEDAPAPPGFEEGWQPHWMAGEANDAPADPRVEQTRSVPEYDEYGRALVEGLPPERSRHFVARVVGRFAGMAWLHEGALFDVFVPVALRRQGLGTALTRAAAEHADGAIVLNATGEGELLYRTLGFQSLGHGRTWWLRV
jgi:GNAT superfamily N-acetyltransferase